MHLTQLWMKEESALLALVGKLLMEKALGMYCACLELHAASVTHHRLCAYCVTQNDKVIFIHMYTCGCHVVPSLCVRKIAPTLWLTVKCADARCHRKRHMSRDKIWKCGFKVDHEVNGEH
jgi:hypothetical protein